MEMIKYNLRKEHTVINLLTVSTILLNDLNKYFKAFLYCAVQDIHTTPTEGIGISWGWGFCKTEKFEEVNEA